MPFAVGNRTRIKLSSAALLAGTLQPQPPVLGVVTKVVGTTISITVPGQAAVAALDASFLDQITDTLAATRNLYIDQVVTGSIAGQPYVDAYTGRVVDVYDVDGVTKVLICSLFNGMYFELPVTSVTVLGGR